MNKTPILFYSVHVDRPYMVLDNAYGEYNNLKDGYCLLCYNRLEEKYTFYIRFVYYDCPERIENEYAFTICHNCFHDRIKNKPLDDLKLIIPLLKIKGIISKVAYENITPSIIGNSQHAVFKLNTSFYKIHVSNKEVLDYCRESEYHKARI